MKQNQLFRIAIVGVLWLCVGAGCQKDPPEPDCWKGQRTRLVKRLDGALAYTDGLTFGFKDTLIGTAAGPLYGAIACQTQWDELRRMNLKVNVTTENNKVRLIDSTRIYSYKVWGTVYELPDQPNVAPIPTLSVWIDKVEEVK